MKYFQLCDTARLRQLIKDRFSIINHTMVADQFKIVRDTKCYKQKTVAEKLGISQSHLSDIERGIKKPSKALIKSYVNLFNVNENWLRTGEGEMFSKQEPFKINMITELEGLYALKEKKAITDAEYQLLKKKLFDQLED